MASELHEFLSHDHDRLDLLLSGCLGEDGSVEAGMYAEFRQGLLRHIGIEERILFPELRKRRGITPLEEQLHIDHAALAALLVPPPSRTEIEQIREILTLHNPLEERDGGLYEILEELVGAELDELMARVHATPTVRVAPLNESPGIRKAIGELVQRALEKRDSRIRS